MKQYTILQKELLQHKCQHTDILQLFKLYNSNDMSDDWVSLNDHKSSTGEMSTSKYSPTQTTESEEIW